jgi:class 3 adenylate cyclase
VTTLGSTKRSALSDKAFAYVDSKGKRRLPIHDEAHVRNALARFSQVLFEDDTARDRARSRLLRAAKKYGIVPIGFIDGQLRASGPRSLPTGVVTFLLTDIEDSTGHVHRLGDGYGALLADARRVIRAAVQGAGGREVDARGDEVFAVFKHAPSAVTAAIGIQRAFRDHTWPAGEAVVVRVGLHTGRPTLTDSGYVGVAVHATARVSSAAQGGQTLVTRAVIRAIGAELPAEVSFADVGTHRLRGLPELETLFQVTVADLPRQFPPMALEPA